ncbi:MAG TPA: hypothetical protein DIU15_07655 [Deltaproteobacteria bacterium]|nr:hypothetical protein [Deltaproteobacteria bacterium]HCP45900.1 hypothetical protein [Deltaproteobacteria bacterium]
MKRRPWLGLCTLAGPLFGAAWLLTVSACYEESGSAPGPIEPFEPPTPPATIGTDTDLVDSMPQEPAPEGVVGLAPGTVARLVSAQTPKPPPAKHELKPDTPVSKEEAMPTSPPGSPAVGTTSAASTTSPASNRAEPASTTPPPKPPPSPVPPPSTAEPSQPKPSTALPPMRVATATVATAVVDRKPQGTSDRFTEGTKVHCFTAIVNDGGGHRKIRHRWIHDGQVKAQVKLNVKATRWRTWSAIPVFGSGAWRVDVIDEAGTVLKSVQFQVD